MIRGALGEYGIIMNENKFEQIGVENHFRENLLTKEPKKTWKATNRSLI